jgi:hypothetical protein
MTFIGVISMEHRTTPDFSSRDYEGNYDGNEEVVKGFYH